MRKTKVVLVTGAAKGIGAAIAKKMASLNYDVVINYLHSENEAKELKKEIEEEYFVTVRLINADVSKEEEVKDMFKIISNEFSSLDCVVNNAAVTFDNYFEEKEAREFLSVLNNNLVGPFLVSKYAGMFMKKQGFGNIINISSTNGIDTNEIYSMDYDASKAGVISLTHNFAKALAPFVRVNAIAPGWTNTKSVREMNPTYLEDERKKIMLERFAEPEEIANVVAFLASDKASYINSTIVRVDGGLK